MAQTQQPQEITASAWNEELLQKLPGFVIPIIELFFRWIGSLIEARLSPLRLENNELRKTITQLQTQEQSEFAQLKNEIAAFRKFQAENAQGLEAKLNVKTAALGTILEALAQAGTTLQQIKK